LIGCLPLGAVNADVKCEAFLGAAYIPHESLSLQRLSRVRAKLGQTYGVSVEHDSNMNTRGSYTYVHKTVKLNPRYGLLEQNVTLHHEAGHVAANENLLNKPQNPDNALAVVIQREWLPITQNLDSRSYSHTLVLDEVKQHYKTMLYYMQIQRQYDNMPDQFKVDGIKKMIDSARNTSLTAAQDGKRLLSELKEFLSRGNVEASPIFYSDEHTEMFWLQFEMPQSNEEPIRIAIPFYDPDFFVTHEFRDFDKRVFEAIDKTQARLNYYIGKISEK
jgi:hypothetical protein